MRQLSQAGMHSPGVSALSTVNCGVTSHILLNLQVFHPPLSTIWVFIIVPFTTWSDIIPTFIIAIQLKSNK